MKYLIEVEQADYIETDNEEETSDDVFGRALVCARTSAFSLLDEYCTSTFGEYNECGLVVEIVDKKIEISLEVSFDTDNLKELIRGAFVDVDGKLYTEFKSFELKEK